MWHDKSRKKISGGKFKERRGKKKSELGREGLSCEVMEKDRRKKVGVRGYKNQKERLQHAGQVNLTDKEKGKTSKEKIDEVIENPANPHFARRDIITKGAIIQTSDGKAKVTSRPGQDGQINAIKIKD